MKRDYKAYINDIVESLLLIQQYIQGVSEAQFLKSSQVQDAVGRRLEIIGEATKNISRSIREQNSHIDWFELSQFRDLLSHSYFGVSPQRIWKIVKVNVPKLIEQFEKIKLL